MPAKKKKAAAKKSSYERNVEQGKKQMNLFLTPEEIDALTRAAGAAGCKNRNEFVMMLFRDWLKGTEDLTASMKKKLAV